MTQAEQVGQQAGLGGFSKKTLTAREFAAFWKERGDEKQETQRFWIELLGDVMGIGSPARYIEFEKTVRLSHTSFIDAYIASTKVLIEQKSRRIDLTRGYEQSDGSVLTPYQQAKRYADELPYDLRPRWIVVSNFREIHVHDMNAPRSQPEIILLENLERELYRLQFLVDEKNEQIRREEEISLQAGILVGKLYDALIKQYIEPDEGSLRSLNILCVRLVFCFYAEDAGLFETRTSFEDYIKSFNLPNLRDAFIKLFKGLDTELGNRDKYDASLAAFPYVNGGLFAAADIEIPNFTQEIVDVLVNDCAPFDWHEISPTIFGAVFESTLNPETRRTGGMHYTSIENIHKVIDPLFMDELTAEFESIASAGSGAGKLSPKERAAALHAFQEKLGGLTFLDPACGSGNFLTETYVSLRRLENRVISILNRGEKVLGFDEFIKVRISQFYGIEINDFAVTVAKTALWIAESQMMAETERIVGMDLDFLPLSTSAFIVEGNALRMDWETLQILPEGRSLIYADKTNIYKVDGDNPMVVCEPPPKYGEVNIVTKEVEFKSIEELQAPETISVEYDYIIGNPPFVGYAYQSERQKGDLFLVDNSIGKNIDYVVGWYIKAAEIAQNKKTRCAFVSTNSITQGEQVAEVWRPLIDKLKMEIDFAYQTFKWTNETLDKKHMAAVHCVIIGFSAFSEREKEKVIFDSVGNRKIAAHINPYLLDAPDIFIEKRKLPLCAVSRINKGSQPTDGGNLIIEGEDYDGFIAKEPAAVKFVREYIGAEEFINNKKRYCLWLVNATPAELRTMPSVVKRIEAVKAMRLKSPKESTRNWAAYPYLFTENRQPESQNYLLIPRVSSERRKYIPVGFLSSDIIASDATQVVPDATLYEFGVLTSAVHNAWMRVVCGRLKSDYRYSNDIVYNNFPWPQPTKEQRAKIEATAQAILDARARYPGSSLADLYDETFMPVDLRKAHQVNDKAVEKAYGRTFSTDDERVAFLFEKYVEMTEGR